MARRCQLLNCWTRLKTSGLQLVAIRTSLWLTHDEIHGVIYAMLVTYMGHSLLHVPWHLQASYDRFTSWRRSPDNVRHTHACVL